MLKDIIKEKGISVYRLAKGSGIPYTTVNEIVLNKKRIEDCNTKTILAISKYLNKPIESLINDKNNTISTSWQDARYKKYSFPIVVKNKEFEINRIHPLKQKEVVTIYNTIKNNKKINSLIVFGSSTTIRCNKNSDIDICIELNKDKINNETKNEISELLQEKLNYNLDIIWKDRLTKNTNIYKNIERGVKIYE